MNMLSKVTVAMMMVMGAVAAQASCITTGQGNSSYTTCSDGSSAYTQHQGNSSYSFYGDGSTGYTQRMGNGTTYQSFSDGSGYGGSSGYAPMASPGLGSGPGGYWSGESDYSSSW